MPWVDGREEKGQAFRGGIHVTEHGPERPFLPPS